HSKHYPAQICINSEGSTSIYEYKKNSNFYFKYPSYILLYFLIFGFFHILFQFQKQRLKKIYETERRLNELQMLTIRNQMNPHFTFNAINSISSVIYKEDKKTAYNFFTRFSDLIRFTLKNAEKIAIPLSEEIEFVNNYLELEKFRFKERFSYNISVDGNIDQEIKVPRMIIQTFAENAVKHGLSHLDKDGLLKIQISYQDHKLIILIEDNGIGREAAGKLDIHGTGKGMKIIDQIFDLYFKLKGKKIIHSITDLKSDDNQPKGTKVIVELEV
ncbi:MAG: histidine kinase, partial [Calditrichales bacterium]|nr:histidine kinase [Calditrichales bacterium]